MRNKSTPVGNVAVICFSGNKGGMEYDAAILVRNIIDYIGKAHLVCRKNTWLNNYAINNKIPHTAIKFTGMTSIRAALNLRELYKKLGVANIIFFGSSEMPTLYMAHSKQIREFIVRHGTTKSRSKKDFVHKLTWSKVTSHWCISRHIENNVKIIFPLGRSKTFVNYVSLGEKINKIRIAAHISENEKVFKIVHVGRLVEGKGQRDAIKVIKKLRDKGINAQLTLYGEGKDESYLRNLTSELNMTQHVFFAGHTELPYLNFNLYHAFLFPSYGEGLGNAFIEALASGMHCYCYQNTVFPELREIGLSFTMVTNSDLDGLFSTMASTWTKKEKIPINNIKLCHDIFSTSIEMKELTKYLA